MATTFRAQILNLRTGDIELGTYGTEAEARAAIEEYRIQHAHASARVIVEGESRYFFVR